MKVYISQEVKCLVYGQDINHLNIK